MDAYRQPLERVVSSMQWFFTAEELRVCHVVTSQEMRVAVLEQLSALEHSSLNTRPFAVLEAPVEADDDGYLLRVAELRDDWDSWRELWSGLEAPVSLPELGPEPDATDHLGAFAGQLAWVLANLPDPCEGVTVVLAPFWVSAPEVWRTTVKALMTLSELRRARFVVVELDEPHLMPVLEELEGLVERVDARVDPEAARAEMRQLVANMASAPPGADGPRLAGLAGPKVAPPPRWNAPAALPEEEAGRVYFDEGLPSGLSDPARVQAFKVALFEAAEAAQDQDWHRAVSRQAAARDLANDLGLERETVLMQTVLGSYQLQGGHPQAAERSYDSARELAEHDLHHDLAAQALMAKASAQLVGKRSLEAAVTYAHAGHRALQTEQRLLAIEAYRLSGQIYAAEGRLDDAGHAWRSALTVAEGAEPGDRKASTAPEAADALAALCRQHGLDVQAEALELQAAALRAEAEELA